MNSGVPRFQITYYVPHVESDWSAGLMNADDSKWGLVTASASGTVTQMLARSDHDC